MGCCCWSKPVGDNPPTDFNLCSFTPDGDLRYAKHWPGYSPSNQTGDTRGRRLLGLVNGQLVLVRARTGAEIFVTAADASDGEESLPPTGSGVTFTSNQVLTNSTTFSGPFAVTATGIVIPALRVDGSTYYVQRYEVDETGSVAFQESTGLSVSGTASRYVAANSAGLVAGVISSNTQTATAIVSATGEDYSATDSFGLRSGFNFPALLYSRVVMSANRLYAAQQQSSTSWRWHSFALPAGGWTALTAFGDYGLPTPGGLSDALLFANDSNTYWWIGQTRLYHAQMDVAGTSRIVWSYPFPTLFPELGNGTYRDLDLSATEQIATTARGANEIAFASVSPAGTLATSEDRNAHTQSLNAYGVNPAVYIPADGELLTSWDASPDPGFNHETYHSAKWQFHGGETINRSWEWRHAGSLIHQVDAAGNSFFAGPLTPRSVLEPVFQGFIEDAWRDIDTLRWQVDFNPALGSNAVAENVEILMTHISGEGAAKRFGGTLNTDLAPQQLTQRFDADGTFNVPDDVSEVTVEVWGAGAAGGGGAITAPPGGGGGGGGGYAKGTLTVTPGGSESIVIGAGGTDLPSQRDGGPSYFRDSSTLQATGGLTGQNGSAGGLGGAGGTGSGSAATLTQTGGSGGDGGTTPDTGGGGGGVAGETGDGGNGVDGESGGTGGEGVGYDTDDGDGGDGGATQTNGNPGGAIGGGGGGGGGNGDGVSGGDGADGLVVVTYTTSVQVRRNVEVFLIEDAGNYSLGFIVHREADPADPNYYMEVPEAMPLEQDIRGATGFDYLDDLIGEDLQDPAGIWEWDGANNVDTTQGTEDVNLHLRLLDFQML